MKTNGITNKDNPESNEVQIPSEPKASVVSLADYKKKKQTEQEVKQVFKQSLDNDQVMKRYNINQPTVEERTEKIKQGIERINKLMEQIKEANK
jgi:predicted flavoprotein YhiN